MAKDTLIIITGGTIDAEAYPDPKNPPEDAIMLEKSLIPLTVAQMGHDARCDYLPWISRDSKKFSAEEMRNLAKIIRTSSAKNIIITHGTDGMPVHCRQIQRLLHRRDVGLPRDAFAKDSTGKERVREDKRVIFTGAMMPLANGPESDGYLNLDYIFGHMDQWKPGVRAVMHSTSFEPKGLYKDFMDYTFHGRVIDDLGVMSGLKDRVGREQEPVAGMRV